MKKLILSTIIMAFSISVFAADTSSNAVIKVQQSVDKQTRKKSFVETITFKPYAGAFASLNDESEEAETFDFKNGAVGLEAEIPVGSNVGIAFDVVGIDNVSDDPVIDRIGVGLNAKLPIKRSKVSLYGQGGLGYWLGSDSLDILLRGGAEWSFTKHVGAFADIGGGVLLNNGNSYQEVRGGLNISF